MNYPLREEGKLYFAASLLGDAFHVSDLCLVLMCVYLSELLAPSSSPWSTCVSPVNAVRGLSHTLAIAKASLGLGQQFFGRPRAREFRAMSIHVDSGRGEVSGEVEAMLEEIKVLRRTARGKAICDQSDEFIAEASRESATGREAALKLSAAVPTQG